MKNIKTEIKWGVIFVIMSLLWLALEKAIGLHDVYIDKHTTYTNLIAIPALLVYFFALRDKRQNFYAGRMTYKQGFLSGLVITLVVTVLVTLTQYITFAVITPDFFQNAIAHAVESGNMTQVDAEAYFSKNNYLIQGFIGAPIMGVVTSAIVAIFTKKKS